MIVRPEKWFKTNGLFGNGKSIGEYPYSESIAYLVVANSLLPFLPRKTCIQGGLCLKIGCLVKKNRRVANTHVGDKEGGGREGGGVGWRKPASRKWTLRCLGLRSSLAPAVGR